MKEISIKYIYTLIIFVLITTSIFSQKYEYSAIPEIESFNNCSVNSCPNWKNGVVKAGVMDVNSNRFTFRIKKCSGSFKGSGYFVVGWDTEIGCEEPASGIASTYVSKGETYADITVEASWFGHGNKSYWECVFNSSNGNTYYAGHITIIRTPINNTCEVPENLHTNYLESTSVTLDWDNVFGKDYYHVKWRETGKNWKIDDVNSSSKDLSNLTPNTDYEFKLRTYCENGERSGYSDIKTFHTLPAEDTKIIKVTDKLNFGNVGIGKSKWLNIKIINNGNSILHITSIDFPDGYSINWNPDFKLQSKESKEIRIKFLPQKVKDYNGTITIHSNKTSGNNTTSVYGKGIIPNNAPIVSDLTVKQVANGHMEGNFKITDHDTNAKNIKWVRVYFVNPRTNEEAGIDTQEGGYDNLIPLSNGEVNLSFSNINDKMTNVFTESGEYYVKVEAWDGKVVNYNQKWLKAKVVKKTFSAEVVTFNISEKTFENYYATGYTFNGAVRVTTSNNEPWILSTYVEDLTNKWDWNKNRIKKSGEKGNFIFGPLSKPCKVRHKIKSYERPWFETDILHETDICDIDIDMWATNTSNPRNIMPKRKCHVLKYVYMFNINLGDTFIHIFGCFKIQRYM